MRCRPVGEGWCNLWKSEALCRHKIVYSHVSHFAEVLLRFFMSGFRHREFIFGLRTISEPDLLFRWPRTCDENIHQPPGALLPVRAGRHVGDADKRPQQIEWVEIFAYVAVLDGALHQGINCFLDMTARTFIQL